MKKIISVFTLVAMLSMSFTVNAAVTKTETAANFSVSYVTEAGEALDLSTLKADDVFCVQVDLENADNIISAGLEFSWDSTILEPVAYDYDSDGKVLTDVWNIYNISNEGDYVANNIQENTAVKSGKNFVAVLSQTSLSAVTANSVKYEVYDPAPTDAKYAETEASTTFLKASFKVKKAGDAKLTFTQAQLQENGMASVVDINVENDPKGALQVGATAPVVPPVTYDDVKTGAFTFFGGSKYNGNEGFKLFFNKTENEVTTEVYAELAKTAIFGENTEVEKDMEVSVGVQVEDVPSNVVLEFLRAEWLETLSK